MLFVEVQRGKDAMNSDQFGEYASEIGVTAAFVKRAEEKVAYCGTSLESRRDAARAKSGEEFHGDSWFASVNAATVSNELGHDFVGPIKTNTAGFPKDEIEELMKDWPSGSYIVLECREHNLVAIGYKYSLRSKSESFHMFCVSFLQEFDCLTSSKVLTFISTWDAGDTDPGDPYVARFPDEFGNIMTREINRPSLISGYFKDADVVDNHNKSRQGDLALEEHWRTANCWFRLITTFFGITVTDTWNAVRHHCTEKSGFKDMSIKRFSECLVYDLWNYPWDERPAAINIGVPEEVGFECEMVSTTLSQVTWSSGSSASGATVVSRESEGAAVIAKIRREHQVVNTERKMKGGPGRTDRMRRTCSMKATGCKGSGRNKTSYECVNRECMNAQSKHNRNTSSGIFICENQACIEKHRNEVFVRERFCY